MLHLSIAALHAVQGSEAFGWSDEMRACKAWLPSLEARSIVHFTACPTSRARRLLLASIVIQYQQHCRETHSKQASCRLHRLDAQAQVSTDGLTHRLPRRWPSPQRRSAFRRYRSNWSRAARSSPTPPLSWPSSKTAHEGTRGAPPVSARAGCSLALDILLGKSDVDTGGIALRRPRTSLTLLSVKSSGRLDTLRRRARFSASRRSCSWLALCRPHMSST